MASTLVLFQGGLWTTAGVHSRCPGFHLQFLGPKFGSQVEPCVDMQKRSVLKQSQIATIGTRSYERGSWPYYWELLGFGTDGSY